MADTCSMHCLSLDSRWYLFSAFEVWDDQQFCLLDILPVQLRILTAVHISIFVRIIASTWYLTDAIYR